MSDRGVCEVCGIVANLRAGKLMRHYALGKIECIGAGKPPMHEAQLARERERGFAPDLRRKVRCPRCRRTDVPVEEGKLVGHRVGRGWPDWQSQCEGEGLPVREGVCGGCAADRGFRDPQGRLVHQHCTKGEPLPCPCECRSANEPQRDPRSGGRRWMQARLF